MAVLILHNSCAIYLSPPCVGGVGIWLTVPVRVRIVSWKKHILLPLLVCPGRQCGVRLLFKSLYRLALSMKVGLKGLKARTRLSRHGRTFARMRSAAHRALRTHRCQCRTNEPPREWGTGAKPQPRPGDDQGSRC